MEKPGQVVRHAEFALQWAAASGAQAGAVQPQAVPGQHALGAQQSLPALPAHSRILRLLQPPGRPAQSHKPATILFSFRILNQRHSGIKRYLALGNFEVCTAFWKSDGSTPACWDSVSPCRGCIFYLKGRTRLILTCSAGRHEICRLRHIASESPVRIKEKKVFSANAARMQLTCVTRSRNELPVGAPHRHRHQQLFLGCACWPASASCTLGLQAGLRCWTGLSQ